MKKTFGDKIRQLLKDNGYSYRVRVFPKKEGVINRAGKKVFQDYEKVVIYAGRNIEKIAQKRSRRLVAWKNEKGEWEGDQEVIKSQNGSGNQIYLLDYHDKTEPITKTLFSDLWEEDAKEFGEKGEINKLLKNMANWKFQEVERGKLSQKTI